MFLSRTLSKTALLLAAVLACFVPSVAFAQPAANRTISAAGVGEALLGSTPDELADALGSDYDLSDEVRITVDFDGRVVSKGGDVQFRAAMTENDDRLTLFIVSNPDYATAEGVGPTTTIADAEAIYGDATLSWNPDNEGREFVEFENGPPGRVFFRTPGIGGTNVGIYGDDEFETTEYDADGAIAAVWVSCIADDCAASGGTTAPEPTAEPTAEPTPTATPEAEVTPTPTPTAEPTPTPTPTAESTPTPTPADPTPTPNSSAGSGGDSSSGGSSTDSGQLPRTGATELVLLALGATLFTLGGAFALIERRFLCPAWLGRKN